MSTAEAPRTDTNDDDLLVENFRNGDRASFDELFNRYKNKVVNFINKMVRDRSIAEEVTQETFIRVYTSIELYESRGSFRAWLYTIASNLAKNELKKRSYRVLLSLQRPIVEAEGVTALEDVLTDKNASPLSVIENNELKEKVESLIQNLPVEYKEVFVLCAMEDFTYEEAAQTLNTNVKTVSSRLARARKRLMEMMKE